MTVRLEDPEARLQHARDVAGVGRDAGARLEHGRLLEAEPLEQVGEAFVVGHHAAALGRQLQQRRPGAAPQRLEAVREGVGARRVRGAVGRVELAHACGHAARHLSDLQAAAVEIASSLRSRSRR